MPWWMVVGTHAPCRGRIGGTSKPLQAIAKQFEKQVPSLATSVDSVVDAVTDAVF